MKVIYWIYTLYAAIIFVLLMILIGPFVLLPILIYKNGDSISFIFLKLWARAWLFFVGIQYKIYGQENIDPKKQYLYLFNHTSHVDAPLIPLSIHQEFRIIGKKELSKIPIFGLVLSKIVVWVDRNDPISRKISIDRLIKIIKTGKSVVMAPEGTRNDTNEPLLPFKKGAFKIALETSTPIMPMAIIGAKHLMQKGSILLKPGRIHVYFSKEILPDQFLSSNDIEGLTQKCYDRMEAMILAHEDDLVLTH
jgi:1-acyl-sn-glycerol-3-phosphate acyltransferase